MGGLFRAPKPVVVAATQPAATPAAGPTAEQALQASRVETQDRARRGLPGTVLTSARGVLDPAPGLPPAAARKSLLGE